MATLIAQPIAAVAGTTVVFSAASAGGDRTAPGARRFLLVKNGSASSINVTLDATGVAFNGALVPDTVVAVPAGAEKLIPLSVGYRSSVDGLAGITYSAVTTVSVAVLAA